MNPSMRARPSRLLSALVLGGLLGAAPDVTAAPAPPEAARPQPTTGQRMNLGQPRVSMPGPIKDLGGTRATGGTGFGIARKGSLLTRDKTLLPPPPPTSRRYPVVGPSRGPVGGGVVVDRGTGVALGTGTVGTGSVSVVQSQLDAQFAGNPTIRLHAGAPVADFGSYRRRVWPVWSSGGQWSWTGAAGCGPRWCGTDYVDYGPVVSYAEGVPYAAGVQYTASTQPQAAPPPEPPPPVEPTDFDHGVEALRDRDPEAAIGFIKSFLNQNADDTGAMRVLAFALLDANHPADAAAMMALAYDRDPSLAVYPLNAGAVVGDEHLRKLLLRAVAYANNVDTASSWLTVIVLMQAEGRDSVARNMLKRAKDRGLAPRIAGELEASLDV
ncbi:MAG: hypothetical protein KF745_06135 [Phycisphaeraceae bacterium]|nr:hypothetical protein [Phycisphaeraceae bacterium]